ncbi:MAG: NAD-binding protein, partial [Spirochaetaceae bacterium]|nr:NAD-binding protein [Spirochaetaceae bacterium]
MYVVIVGAGQVGFQLASLLTLEKHDVGIIERDEARVRQLSSRIDCLTVHADGASLSVLEEAGIAQANVLVAVTDNDEQNMIICGIAASRYANIIKIARVHNEDYVQLRISGNKEIRQMVNQEKKFLGIDHFIHPDVESARAAIRAIEHGAIGDVLSFSNSDFELNSVEIRKGSVFDGLSLLDWRKKVTRESLVTLIERDGKSLLPSGSTKLKKGDRVHILSSSEGFDNLFQLAGSAEKPIRSVGIVGASKIGTLVADGLCSRGGSKMLTEKARSFFSFFKSLILKSNRRIVIIEQDAGLCKELSAQYP